ncbi:zinc finger protein 37-like [Culicoides brevitarsis]|uniref:zinc finger protein 37-like n=1 Tax=Culicoides brevitarsis TaxID=469753 RepID=UPI00307B3488
MKKYCRICFKNSEYLQDLNPFLPILRILVNTKLPREESSKICKSCANGLILSNLFRAKVIESNAKYREFINEKSVALEVAKRNNDGDDERMSDVDNEMHVEFLDDSLFDSGDEAKSETSQNKKTHKVKGNVKQELIEDARNDDILCFMCSQKAKMTNNISPFKTTLKKIISIENNVMKSTEKLCDTCLVDLKALKTFFTKREALKPQKFNKNCCQFCSIKDARLLSTSKSSLALFKSLPQTQNYDPRNRQIGKTCENCIQVLNQIKCLRDNYSTKRNPVSKKLKSSFSDQKQKLIEMIKNEVITEYKPKPKLNVTQRTDKKQKVELNITPIDVSSCEDPKKELISRILADMSGSLSTESNDKMPQRHVDSLKKTPKIKIRAKSRYKIPDPDKPIPDDYQCHMSDFEELDSDSEMPPIHFRAPLNAPFTPIFFKCTECTAKFVNSYELEAHIDCSHRTTTNVCDICQKEFRDIPFTKAHKLRVHYVHFSTFDYKSQCEICGILTKRIDDHLVQHLGTRPYHCEHCNYAGKTKFGLQSHISAIHLGEKKHKCKYCGKGFNYSADRGRHEIAVHTKQFKYVCKFCGKCCLKKNFLTAHVKSHHPDEDCEL